MYESLTGTRRNVYLWRRQSDQNTALRWLPTHDRDPRSGIRSESDSFPV